MDIFLKFYPGLFKFSKIQRNFKFSFSGALAAFEVLNNQVWLVP